MKMLNRKLNKRKTLPYQRKTKAIKSNVKEQGSDCSDFKEILDKAIENEYPDLMNSNELEGNIHSDSSEDENQEDECGDEMEKHKKSLLKLKITDPEFYKFLEENDRKLLQFSAFDEEESDAEAEDERHIPADKLDVASDDSDFEGDDEDESTEFKRVINLKMLKNWQSNIQTDKSNKTIIELTQAFHAALMTVSNDDEEDNEQSKYQVKDSSVFNGVIQLCVLELGPAIRKFLGLTPGSKLPPHKCKKFSKLKGVLKAYFNDLLKLLHGVTSANIQTVLLKHLHYMSPMLVSFPNIARSIVKRLITIWGTADDGVRVIAFFCILRITNNNLSSLLDTVLRAMYSTYVKNSKFVSVNTLASINFMKRSLVEMYSLDVNLTYHNVFLYTRQLALYVRTAMRLNSKENVQAVCNWQFINSLKLWENVLSVMHNKQEIEPLVYPFIQVCLATLKLVPTTQYFPLRFHVVQLLVDFSRDTGVFIPILPFILEVLTIYDFNKKHQKVSMKPLNFTCLLRLSKSQLSENGFKDATIESVYALLLEYLSNMSHTVGFPDLTLWCTIQLKQFLKTCNNTNYKRKIKQILEKIEENSKFIEKERSKLTIPLADLKRIEGWESQIKSRGTPLTTFFNSWNKIHTIKKNKQMTNNEALADYKLPKLKKHAKKVVEDDEGPVELFPSGSEDEETNLEKKGRKRGSRGGKNVPKRARLYQDHGGVEDDGTIKDIIEDLRLDDW